MRTALALAVLLLAGCQGETPGGVPKAEPPATRSVRTVTLGIQPIQATLEAMGSVRSKTQSVVASKVLGYVREVRVREGDRVRSGDLLVSIDEAELKTRVERIEWSSHRVRVQATGEDGVEFFEAPAAVVTLPVGVLKAGDVVFEPPLPEAKLRAIEAIGYGEVVKILLAFDPSARASALGQYRFVADEDGGFYFLPLGDRTDGPVLVEGFIAGRKARGFSGRPEREVVDEVVRTLSAMVSDPGLRAKLREARVIDWVSDPYSKGAYTFQAVGGGIGMRRALAEPLGGVLFFAGEATHTKGEYATVHGALETGERVAHEVLAALETQSHAS